MFLQDRLSISRLAPVLLLFGNGNYIDFVERTEAGYNGEGSGCSINSL